MPAKSRRWYVAAVSAPLGAATAVGLVWFTRPKPPPPGSVILDNGMPSTSDDAESHRKAATAADLAHQLV